MSTAMAEAFEAFTRTVGQACPPMPCAAFGIGYVVQSTKACFRGVVVGVDPVYSQEPEWRTEAAKTDPLGFAADQPWYEIIGDSDVGPVARYCPERLLAHDNVTMRPVQNPAVATWFYTFRGDRYDYVRRHDA